MLPKLPLDSLQQRRARSRVLMLYRIWNGLVAIPAAAYLEPISICTRRFETRCVQIQCNTGTYSQTYASAVRLWNTLPVGICQLPGNSSKTHLCSFHFIWAPDDFLFLLSALHSKVTVHCLLHGFFDTYLLTHGVILLEIKLHRYQKMKMNCGKITQVASGFDDHFDFACIACIVHIVSVFKHDCHCLPITA